jgi:hypothetical protein
VKLKTWALAGAAVLVAVAAIGSLVVVVSGGKDATAAAQEPPVNTAKVLRGDLSAMVSLDGTLTYRARADGSPFSAINRAGGIYTDLPDVGDKVGRKATGAATSASSTAACTWRTAMNSRGGQLRLSAPSSATGA